jgi:hypothetical protein
MLRKWRDSLEVVCKEWHPSLPVSNDGGKKI